MGDLNNRVGRKWLKELGFENVDVPMAGEIEGWWAWFRSEGAFYSYLEEDDTGRTYKVERISFAPAKMTCEDWVSVELGEPPTIGVSGVMDLPEGKEADTGLASANEWLQGWVADERLVIDEEPFERGFALGTAGWDLELEDLAITGEKDPRTKVRARHYDARHIVPLTFDGEHCTEIGFCRGVTVRGKAYTQWRVHKLASDGSYDIHTAHFQANGHKVDLEGYSSKVATGIKVPMFALFRPALDNTYWEHSPFGVSVFDSALGAVKLADGSFDNTWKDIHLGQKMLFLPEEIIKTDKDGNAVIPREKDQQLFVGTPADRVGQSPSKPYEYNPDLRVNENRKAIDTGLSLLGKRVGFGFKYYSLDEEGGINKTAREVISDNAELQRNAQKHARNIEAALTAICEGAAALADRFCEVSLPDLTGKVSVLFADMVVEDEGTERERMRADVAAGLVPAWKYVEKYYGVDEETAKEWVAGAGGVAGGSDAASSLNGAQMTSLMGIMAQYASGEITEGQAINLISTAIGVDKATAKKLLDGDVTDMLSDIPVEA